MDNAEKYRFAAKTRAAPKEARGDFFCERRASLLFVPMILPWHDSARPAILILMFEKTPSERHQNYTMSLPRPPHPEILYILLILSKIIQTPPKHHQDYTMFQRVTAGVFEEDPFCLATGYWLLVTGYWLLATGYWLLVTGHWLLVTGNWSPATGHPQLVIRFSAPFPPYFCPKIKCFPH
jgi:hypothetical protein